MAGRGRGEAANLHRIEDDPAPRSSGRSSSSSGDTPAGTSSSGETGDRPVRGRGGYRTAELNTIPTGIKIVQADCEPSSRKLEVTANYVKITPMKMRDVYKYRVDFEPTIESVPVRKRMLRDHFRELGDHTFDGYSELRVPKKLPDKVVKDVVNPGDPDGATIRVTLKNVGKVDWSSFEMIRLYNMMARTLLEILGFYPININAQRAYLHPNLITNVGSSKDITLCGGFRTAVNMHMGDNILMNMESVHKVIQTISVYEMISNIMTRYRGGNFQEAVKSALVNKLVVTQYKKIVYKIEDIAFNETPATYRFRPENETDEINLVQFFQRKHSTTVRDQSQPLLVCIRHGNRPRDGQDPKQVRLVPELCKMAGMTEDQVNRLRIDMIKSTQIPPATRVAQMKMLLDQLNNNAQVQAKLQEWGFSYASDPVKVPARQLAYEAIQLGSVANITDQKRWPKVDMSASFDNALIRDQLVKRPTFAKMAILIPKSCSTQENLILTTLRSGFNKIGLAADSVEIVRMIEGETAGHYVNYLRKLPDDTTATLIIMPFQNKEKYDAIKKHAACDRGMVTQVVTAKLLQDQKKANGASVKIGIQVAAKIGGEPWYISFPLKNVMVCGYDTYHDTVNRLVSFGAFVGSLNEKCSQWYSKVDRHDQISELSSHLTENLICGLKKYKNRNGVYPERLFIYRDGVGDGQIEHVYNSEVQQIKRAINEKNPDIKLTFIIVNKRIGARFYLQTNPTTPHINCQPGTVIDGVVTRKERFDFYLISQSTRAGTVSPTYYNIINDESGLAPARHQAMAYKFCFLYYNWAGSVRVPAPCQYAHKLALLCGEHLHSPPSTSLEEKLHFL